jgi:HEAT repeat protein
MLGPRKEASMRRSGRASAAVGVAFAAALLAGTLAGDGVARAADEDPPLEGAAAAEHAKAVKQVVAFLRGEKNRETVRRQIEALGRSKKREDRDGLIEFARGNSNHEFVGYAFRALAQIGGKTVLLHLTGKDALRSGEFLVQVAAGEALASMKDKRATPALLEVLDGRLTKIQVQAACLEALGVCAQGDAAAIAAVMRFADHKHDTVRTSAYWAVGDLRTDAGYALLADRLRTEKNTRCRGAAATGLGRTGRKEAVPLLEKAAAEDDADTVRECAEQALRTLGRKT